MIDLQIPIKTKTAVKIPNLKNLEENFTEMTKVIFFSFKDEDI